MGIIICSQCGAQSSDTQRFCTNCGAPLKQEQSNKGLFTTAQPVPATPVAGPISKPATVETINSIPTARQDSNEALGSDTFLEALQQKTRKMDTRKKKEKLAQKSRKPSGSKSAPKKEKSKSGASSQKINLTPELHEKLLEHLDNLNKMDKTLEASLILRWKAKQVLAAASSSRAPEDLLSTLASHLWTINSDA
ncbi:MAG: zinc ribbon domain-containing protein [Candidatus Helarchaeales archaeon]